MKGGGVFNHPMFKTKKSKQGRKKNVKKTSRVKEEQKSVHPLPCKEFHITAELLFEEEKKNNGGHPCTGTKLKLVLDTAARIYNISTGEISPWFKSSLVLGENNVNSILLGRLRYGFGFDPATNEHKLVCVWVMLSTAYYYICEVLTIGREELDIEEQFEGRSTLLERKDEAGNSEPNNPYEGRILKYSRPLWNKNEGESGICMGATIDNPMSEAGYVSDDKGKDSKAAKRVSNPMSDAGSVSGDKGKDSKAAKRVSKVADILKKIGVAYAVDYLKEFYGPKKVKALIVTLLLDELFFESEIYKAFESFLVKLPFLFNEIFEASKPYILNQLPRYSESYGAIKSYILLLLNICNELFEAVKPTTVSTSNINFLSTKLMGSVESPSFLRKSHLSKKLIEALEHVNSREKFLLLLEEYIFALEEYISVFEGYLPGSNFVSDYSNTFVFTFFMCFELIRKYMGRRFLYGRLYQRRP